MMQQLLRRYASSRGSSSLAGVVKSLVLLVFLLALYVESASPQALAGTQRESDVAQSGVIAPDAFDVYGWFQGFGYPGISGQVYTAEVVGADLYVGGWFDGAGGVPTNSLAKFNGQTGVWSGFGLDPSVQVNDILVDGNQVYVAGRIEIGSILYGVAVWDGSVWTPLGGEINGDGYATVYALAIHQGQLYAAGIFTSIGNTPVNHIARWNGSRWEPLGSGLSVASGLVEGRTLLSVGNQLYVGGRFDLAGGVQAAHNLAVWQDGQWGAVADIAGRVSSLVWDGSSLYVGGQFYVPNQSWTSGIVRVQGGQTHSVAGGLNPGAWVQSILLANGRVYVAGNQIWAGLYTDGSETRFNSIGFFDGSRWNSLGSGLSRTDGSYPDIPVLLTWQGKLLAAGFFDRSAGTTLPDLGLWDGSQWSRPPLSQGIAGGVNGMPSDLTVVGADLYVAGNYTLAGDQEVPGLARWDGDRWHRVGDGALGGLKDAKAVTVNRMGIFVAGQYEEDPQWGAVSRMARWDGSQWQLIGEPFTGDRPDLFTDGDSVYVRGGFHPFGPDDPRSLARWDGSQWFFYPMSPYYGSIDKAEAVNGVLYACGSVYGEGRMTSVLTYWAVDHWEQVFPDLVEPVCLWSSYQGAIYLTANFKRQGQYGPVVVETSPVKVQGAQWKKISSGASLGAASAISSNGSRFIVAPKPYPPQFADPGSIYPPTAGIQWALSGISDFRPVPNSESIYDNGSMPITTYGDMLLVSGMNGNLVGWQPPSADVALSLDAPAEVRLDRTLDITGSLSLPGGEAGVFVAAAIDRQENVATIGNGRSSQCSNTSSFACYWRILTPQKVESFAFSASPTYLGRLYVEMKTSWTGLDTNSDNDRAGVGANVYDTFLATPAGGRFPFWFSADKLVDLTLPTGAISTTLEMRIGGGAVPTPGAGQAMIEPVFNLRANALTRTGAVDFSLPISTTIRYAEVDSQRVVESSLSLMRYEPQSGQWIPSQTDCVNAAASAPSPERNRVYAPICRSGTFALVGEARPLLFLPQIERSGE